MDDHRPPRPGTPVRAADDFFLHVEATGAPQIAGGIALLEPAPGREPSLGDVRALVHGELPNLPHFRDRVVASSRWRRPRWVAADDLDLAWHVTERRSPDGMRGLEAIVAELAEQAFPRDRPLWRCVWVRDVGPGRSALVFLMQHALGDGVGTVTNSLQLMRPRTALPGMDGGPGRLARAAATSLGMAQLATGGAPGVRTDAGSPRRSFVTAHPSLDEVRRVAKDHGVRITDLLLGLVAEAVHATHPELADRLGGRLRVAVSRLVPRAPGEAAANAATAAVMVELPLDDRPIGELLAETARRAEPMRKPTRAMAARFALASGLRLVPEPGVGWFARTVYGRRFFEAIVTNFPGPTTQLSLGGVDLDAVYPILPLAPGAPIALGALSWNGLLNCSLAADPAYVDGPAVLARVEKALADLSGRSEPPG